MMNAILNQKKHSVLRTFIPLNGMSDAQFDDICSDVEVEECEKGVVLFEQGESTQEFIYLISGMVSLYAGDKELETIVTGSEVARFAIAHQSPRKVKAVAKSKVRIVRIETYKLDVIRAPQGKDESVVVGAVEDGGEDWMSMMLQSSVYKQLPASNLQKIMINLQEVSYGAGESVIKQGEKVDYYYIIKSGSCDLVRRPSKGARAVRLPEELSNCDTFGEEALLSGRLSDVTVRMKDGGQILRLPKSHFIGLVKKPVLKYVSFKRSKQEVSNGAAFLDVREMAHYNEGHIDGSINIPLFSLRRRFSELNKDHLHILVCEKGNESEAGVFVLLKLGFNAVILNDGMKMVKKDALVATECQVLEADDYPEVAVVKVEEIAMSEAVTSRDSEQAKADAGKIKELETQCVDADAQLDTLKLELRELRSEYEHKAIQASQHEAASILYQERLEVQHENQLNQDAKLKASLSVEKDKNNALLQELEKENAEYDQVFLELESSHAKLEASQLSLAELESESTKSEQCIANQLLELDGLKEQIQVAMSSESDVSKELLEQLADAENKNVIQKSANVELQKRISDSKVEFKKQTDLKKEADLSLASFKLEIEGLEEKLSDIEQSFEEASATSLDLTGKLTSTEGQGAELTAKNTELQVQLEKVQDEFEKLLNDKHQMGSELDTLTAKLQVSQDEFHALEESLVIATDAAEKMAVELQEAKQQNASQKDETNELQQKVEVLELSAQAMTADYKDAELSATSYKLELENMEAKLNEVELSFQEASANSLELTNQLSNADVQQTELKTKNGGLQGQIEAAKQQSASYKDEVNKLEWKVEELELSAQQMNTNHKESELGAASSRQAFEELEAKLSKVEQSYEEAAAASLELTNKLSNAGVEQAELMVKNAELQKQVEDAQHESDMLLSSKSETNSEVETLAQALEVSQKALSETEKDLTQTTKLLDEIKSGNDIESSSFEQQVEQMAESLKSSKDEKAVLSDNLRKLEQSLAATSGAAERAAAELDEFKQQNVSEKDVVNQLQQRIEELELSSQQVSEEYKDKAVQLLEQLERVENEAKNSLNKEKEIIELNETIEQEKMTLEERLLIANKEKVELLKKVNRLDKKPTHVGSSQSAGSHVAKLEKQLCEATTALLDLEIKLEGEASANESLSKDETSELLALKGELNLVREQAESDIKTMQTKVENSERMNLSLNKKILSMQAVATQENEASMASNKKKSWWK